MKTLCEQCKHYVKQCGIEPAHCMARAMGYGYDCKGSTNFRIFEPIDGKNRQEKIDEFLKEIE